jgi:hypothetical protein
MSAIGFCAQTGMLAINATASSDAASLPLLA